MATIDYKQKIKDYMNSSEVDTLYKSLLSNLFPELKESEDERIRKWLIEMVEEVRKANPTNVEHNGMCSEALAWLEKQGEQKPADWSEEDESIMNAIYKFLDGSDALSVDQQQAKYWLKSLKERVGCEADCTTKQEWKQENIDDLTDFENVMMHIGDSFFGQHAGLDPNDTNAIKEQANILLGLIPKQEWSKRDYNKIEAIACHLDNIGNEGMAEVLRNIIDKYYHIIYQTSWKPSEEQLDALERVVSERQSIALESLYEDIRKLKY